MFKKTLLIVDDTEVNRVILKEVFQDDYKLIEAQDGNEALEIIKRENEAIACVLLDLDMPNKDGFEVLEAMNSDPSLYSVPVVVVTAFDDPDTAVKALKLGAEDVVTKPFNQKILVQRIKSLIKRHDYENMKIENIVLRRQSAAQMQLNSILKNSVSLDDIEALKKIVKKYQ